MENLYGSNENTDIQIDDAGNLYAAPQVTVKLETMERKSTAVAPKFCT